MERDIIIKDKTIIEKRETIIIHMNNALDMMERMDKDKNMRLAYSDYDFEKFIDRCREILTEEWHCPIELEVPF